jgi:hypothetical protein
MNTTRPFSECTLGFSYPGDWCKRLTLLITVGLAIFGIHLASPICSSGDSRWAIPIALSILHERNVDIDEYANLRVKWKTTNVVSIKNHTYSFFPTSTYLFAVPVVAVFSCWWDKTEILREYCFIERFTASVIVALAGVFVFLIASRTLGIWSSVALVFVFAFCSPVWSVASRALWQHGPSILVLTIVLYLLLKAVESNRKLHFFLVGAALGVSYVLRPTNSISVVVISTYIAVFHVCRFPFLCCGVALIAGLFALGNFAAFGIVIPPYYSASRLGLHPFFTEALVANIWSPNRGLVLYFPLSILALFGSLLAIAKGEHRKLDCFLIAIVPLHWLAISAYEHWWGGHSYGGRFWTDMVPLFVYFLIPVFREIAVSPPPIKATLIAVLLPIVVWSFFVHARGAIDPNVYWWSTVPTNIDMTPDRIWDWGDVQYLRSFFPRLRL